MRHRIWISPVGRPPSETHLHTHTTSTAPSRWSGALTAMIQASWMRKVIGTTPRTLARILIRYWYGLSSRLYNDEPPTRVSSSRLPRCVQLLRLPAHYVLQLKLVPRRLVEVYARTLCKITKDHRSRRSRCGLRGGLRSAYSPSFLDRPLRPSCRGGRHPFSGDVDRVPPLPPR